MGASDNPIVVACEARGFMAWAQVRTILIGLHVLAVLVLSLPSPARVVDPSAWSSENAQRDLENWASRLSWVGYDTKQQFEADLWSLAKGYSGASRAVRKPFSIYAQLSGTRQGWSMFSSPQKHPAEFHVDIRSGSEWIPVYRPFSKEYDFWARELHQNRFRKLMGRFARTFYRERYDSLARFLATRVAQAYPDASFIRVRLYRYATLPPSGVREGFEPTGRYEHDRLYLGTALR